jgi:hypothetical protein
VEARRSHIRTEVYDRRRLVRLARNLSRDLVDADANERETASLVALLVAEHDRLDSGDFGLTCCLDVTPHLPTVGSCASAR